jgi:hypothetical protein
MPKQLHHFSSSVTGLQELHYVCFTKGTVWMVENDLPLLFAPTNICPLGCLDGGVNVDVDERGRAGPTTNLLQFATF